LRVSFLLLRDIDNLLYRVAAINYGLVSAMTIAPTKLSLKPQA
jgi:hypothetical protein